MPYLVKVPGGLLFSERRCGEVDLEKSASGGGRDKGRGEKGNGSQDVICEKRRNKKKKEEKDKTQGGS